MVLTPVVPEPGFEIAVTVTELDGGQIAYRLSLVGSVVMFDPPSVDGRPLIRIEVDHLTAQRIASAEMSAQRAFMAGDLRVTGDVTLLIEYSEVLGSVAPLFGPLDES